MRAQRSPWRPGATPLPGDCPVPHRWRGHRVRAGECRRWDRVPPRLSASYFMPTPAKRRTGRSPPASRKKRYGLGLQAQLAIGPPGSRTECEAARRYDLEHVAGPHGPAGALPGGQSSHRPGRPGSCRPVRLPPATSEASLHGAMEFVGTLAQAGGQPVVPGRIVDERLQRSPARQVIDIQQQLGTRNR